MHAIAEPTRQQLIRFRGRSYVAFVFTPVVPIVGWLEEIDATLARSPGFFIGRPVVLDLAGLDLSAGHWSGWRDCHPASTDSRPESAGAF